jgi:NADPH:quinone reductase-like Zn-dependent oxidoreductase
VGDRVVSHLYTKWIDGAPSEDYAPTAVGGPIDGGLAEYMLLEEYAAVMAPENLTNEEASTLPIAPLTVSFSLVEYGKIKAGEIVLVLGTGGVSVFAIQIASALGAHVIVTTSSVEKGERVKALGAKEVINYVKTPDWEQEVLKLTDGKGAQHILEVVGGDSINRSIEALALQGHIYIIGFLKSMMAEVNLFTLLAKQAQIHGIYVGHRKAFNDMNKAFNELNIHPVIDTVYSFDKAIKAYEHLGRGAFGKIVIKVSE